MARHVWTNIEVDILRLRYPDTPAHKLVELLGVSERGVYAKAHSLGLKKTDEYLASPHSGRLRPGSNQGGHTRFVKGQVPFNKGMKGLTYPGCVATQFQPGRPAHEARNYQPIGSTRVSKDGYLERKVTDDPSLYPARRWVGIHRLVWKAAHGPIPAGYVVVFRRGMRTHVEAEITVDRLELITRQELMRRNTVHNLPKAVVEVVQLRGALKRKINRLEKRHEQHD